MILARELSLYLRFSINLIIHSRYYRIVAFVWIFCEFDFTESSLLYDFLATSDTHIRRHPLNGYIVVHEPLDIFPLDLILKSVV